MTASIQPLKKVTLSLIAGSDPNILSGSPVIFQFIHGVASGGFCPFEGALHDKAPGDSLTLQIATSEAQQYFGHLLLPLRQALDLHIMPATIHLKVDVTAVSDAENREVVQSLAKASSGCGGSCGCGC